MKNARVKEENCKCKVIQIPENSVADDVDSNHFYHLEISLLEGRTKKVTQKIGQESLKILMDNFMDIKVEDLKQFSVEIRKIEHRNYFTSNTL